MKKYIIKYIFCAVLSLLYACGTDEDNDTATDPTKQEEFVFTPYIADEQYRIAAISVSDLITGENRGGNSFLYNVDGKPVKCGRYNIEYIPGVSDDGYKYEYASGGSIVTGVGYFENSKNVILGISYMDFRVGDGLGTHQETYRYKYENSKITNLMAVDRGFYELDRYFEYDEDCITRISEVIRGDSDNKGYRNEITFEYTSDPNNYSVDLNKYVFSYDAEFVSNHNMWDDFVYTGDIGFDVFGFLGKRDKYLIKTINWKFYKETGGDASAQFDFEYEKDELGRIRKFIITKVDTYYSKKIEKRAFEITYK
jgi:lipoprotein